MPDRLSPPGAVVMAVYRPDPTLFRRQLDSLRGQSVTNWQCLIGIDGPDPETMALSQSLVDGDPRFEVFEYQDHVGVYRHFERLLANVPKAVEWVSLADQDDYWYPDKFERMLPGLFSPGVSAVSAQARLVDRYGTTLGRTHRISGTVADILLRNQISGALTIFRRFVLDLASPFPEPTQIAVHDHWLGVVSACAGRIDVLDVAVQDYVQHGGNALGEPGLPRPRPSGRQGRRPVGLRAYAYHVAHHRWGWRISMARQALGIAGRSDDAILRGFARGTLTPGLLAVTWRGLRTRRISVRDAIGFTAAPLVWTALRGSSIGHRPPPTRSGAPRRLKAGIVVPLFEPDNDVVGAVAMLTEQSTVVCVDDGSSAASAAVLDGVASLPGVSLIRQAENRGIAAALNRGVQRLLDDGLDVVVTFDQDSMPMRTHVATLIRELSRSDSQLGVIGPGHVGGVPVTPAATFADRPVPVHSIIQSGMAVRAEVFEKVGLFDESLFIDGVDTDFCLRAARGGFRVVALPALDIAHRLGGQTGLSRNLKIGRYRPTATHHAPWRRYYMNRNAVLLLKKHATAHPVWAAASLRHLMMSNLLSLTVEPQRARNLTAVVRGIAAGMRQSPVPFPGPTTS